MFVGIGNVEKDPDGVSPASAGFLAPSGSHRGFARGGVRLPRSEAPEGDGLAPAGAMAVSLPGGAGAGGRYLAPRPASSTASLPSALRTLLSGARS